MTDHATPSYSLKDIENALSMVHFVASSRRSAFAGRLKHLQRMGFPPGVNTGRGRPASYGPPELLLLAIVLELNEFGISPERAVQATLAEPELLGEGLQSSLSRMGRDGQIICNIPARGLYDLSEDPTLGLFLRYMTFDEARKSLELIGDTGAGARFAMFSLTGLINILMGAVCNSRDERDNFAQCLFEWAGTLLDNKRGD